MPNRTSTSRSPRRDRRESRTDHYVPRRSRSRSPRRNDDRVNRHRREQEQSHRGRGFKWKVKQPHSSDESDSRGRRLERGYRNRSPSRSPRREYGTERSNAQSSHTGRSIEVDKQSYKTVAESGTAKNYRREPDDRAKAEMKPVRPPPNNAEPMIIVHVNDRLGTRAAIPCLASDPIRLFKAQVAARIGRQPHEIMLKRQGERPFKDQLTLEDYGVSNGVQIDLEIDTGE